MHRLHKIRLSIIAAAALVALICAVLLLNITAPNPTGRRYSSQAVIMQGANSRIVGDSAEAVLAGDLGIPNNNADDQRLCLCGTNGQHSPQMCRSCAASVPEIATFRIPDFVGPSFIADSKNERLYPSRHDLEQLTDMVAGAKLLGKPLWVYVRVCTLMKPEAAALNDLIVSTGGGVLLYFTGENCPGWVDPVDQMARAGLVGAFMVLGVFGVWEYRALRPPRTVTVPAPAPRPQPGKGPFDKADTAADFAVRQRDRARRDLDVEDARGDMK